MLPLQEVRKELFTNHLCRAFCATGIYPYNPAAMLKVLLELKANEDRVAGMQPEDEITATTFLFHLVFSNFSLPNVTALYTQYFSLHSSQCFEHDTDDLFCGCGIAGLLEAARPVNQHALIHFWVWFTTCATTLPLIQELQDRVQGAQWFTKMDLKNGFQLFRIREGDEWKTAFRTRYSLFEFQVMPFGLTNTPSTFQDMMNHIFSDMLDVGVLAYMDDILIYADTEERHDNTVREVLKRLQENGLAVSPEKCVWKTQEVEFLGYIIGQEGIKMSQEKVEAVLSWQRPNSLTEVQSFIGFANFYRCFIQDYSRVARPLTELTKKEAEKEWAWNPEAETAFKELKQRFTTAPVLAHFDASKPVIIETDVSDFAIGAVLSQRDEENRLHPVVFHSRKFQPAEINYEIHDKELLAVVDAFKHWRRYCEGATHQVQDYSGHQNLEYFTTMKVLNRRQARWAQELAGIDFRIYYRPGTQNGKPDALSRHSEYRPEKGGVENQPITSVLRKNHFEERLASTFICSSA